jgi:predicted metal-dependent phosphoesterase TrpH
VSRAFIDLHCHSSASFDSLARPADIVRVAAERGLTHLAITDHDRIDGAIEARRLAPPGLTVLVGQEIRTTEGDLIGVFLERPVPSGLPPRDAIGVVHLQGGLVGLPHPFDQFRGSLGRHDRLAELAPHLDWVEVHNARLVGSGNDRALEFARQHGLPGVAVSDAHSTLEIGVAYSIVDGDPSTAAGLREALVAGLLVRGRASYFTRLVTPVAKVLQRARGNGRGRSTGPSS